MTNIMIVKLYTGETVIAKCTWESGDKVVDMTFPLLLDIEETDESNYQVIFSKYLKGGKTDDCFVMKNNIITTYEPTDYIEELYMELLMDASCDETLIKINDEIGYNYRNGNIKI